MSYILEYKPIGMTPNEHMDIIKKRDSIEKLCFVGRLDPMAHGLMIYLKNEECKKMNSYLASKKTYNFKILFGIETDSYDILGKIMKNNNKIVTETELKQNLKLFTGTYNQKFPPFSSKRVNGKPLWKHTLENNINDIKIPSKEITVYNLTLNNFKILHQSEILKTINNKINKLKSSGFRNEEILRDWSQILETKYYLGELTAEVSSGTYIRSICHDLGISLQTNAIAYDILRTKIDDYKL